MELQAHARSSQWTVGEEVIIAVTGHRPEDCPEEEFVIRDKFGAVYEEVKPNTVIVGMASGVDLWAGHEAILRGIPTWAARPWRGHRPRKSDEELYQFIIDNADLVHVVTDVEEYPGPWVYHKRNEWMVDHSTHVLAYWSGKQSGGTFSCLNYARDKKNRPIRNICAISTSI